MDLVLRNWSKVNLVLLIALIDQSHLVYMTGIILRKVVVILVSVRKILNVSLLWRLSNVFIISDTLFEALPF